MKKTAYSISAAALILGGCATQPDKISASYVSPILYQNLSCQQLASEAANISQRAAQATGEQSQRAGQDAAAVAVGMVIFWPALFLARGDGAAAAEVARLKGEMEAIESASKRKGCGIVFKKEKPKPKNNPNRPRNGYGGPYQYFGPDAPPPNTTK